MYLAGAAGEQRPALPRGKVGNNDSLTHHRSPYRRRDTTLDRKVPAAANLRLRV